MELSHTLGRPGQGKDTLRVRGKLGDYCGPQCYMKRRDVSNFGDPLRSGNASTKKSHSGRAGGWDREKAPEAVRNTHTCARAWRQE